MTLNPEQLKFLNRYNKKRSVEILEDEPEELKELEEDYGEDKSFEGVNNATEEIDGGLK